MTNLLSVPIHVWYDAKIAFERSTTVTTDAIHIFSGMLIFIAAGLVLRVPLTRWRPWLVVLVLILFNEFVDLSSERWPVRAMQYGEGLKDLALTLGVPTIILLTARAWPRLYGSKPRKR